ncbi:MAG: nucleotidyltransferase family protein [Oscillospiraceae bacterium]|nr:nucleotidyltransferase family protein [Oscillospiraceae bacterium]
MEVCGILAEYNPFHNGHKYQIDLLRETGVTHIVAFMSGNFVQRGDIAVTDKFTRAKYAIENGVDLVIEMPTLYTVASAHFYAKAAYSLMQDIGCIDSVSFGCETSDIEILKKAASFSEEVNESLEVKEKMSEGISYPAAIESLADDDISIAFSSPNNILTVEYIRQINERNLPYHIYPIKRLGPEHDSSDIVGNIASASHIRELMRSGEDYSDFVPYGSIPFENVDFKTLETITFYKLRTMKLSELALLPETSSELASRFYNAIRESSSLDEFLVKVKTKRFPQARIRRTIYSAILGLSKTDYLYDPPYIRVLALNQRGAEVLRKAKTTTRIPISTSVADLMSRNGICERFVNMECTATDVYNILKGNKMYKSDMTAKIEITETNDEF